jgi:NADH:ubiquinone oxidoreductase subunit F (NADH-binding)
MKKLTVGLLISTYVISSFSSYAGISEDAQRTAENVKKQIKTATKKVLKKGKDGIEKATDVTGDIVESITKQKADAVATSISESVQKTPAFERARKNLTLANKALVEMEIIYFGSLVTWRYCTKSIDSFPYRKQLSCEPCREGLRKAHQQIFKMLKKAQKA